MKKGKKHDVFRKELFFFRHKKAVMPSRNNIKINRRERKRDKREVKGERQVTGNSV